MTDLVAFLRARLDEDEQAARAAIQRSGAQWHVKTGQYDDAAVVGTSDEYHDQYRMEEGLLWDWEGGFICAYVESVEHIARHDPARVLAELDAKRQIVELLQLVDVAAFSSSASTASLAVTKDDDGDIRYFYEPCLRALRLLALPYADHEDYREEWRP